MSMTEIKSEPNIEVLIAEEAIQERIREMAKQINETYKDSERVIVIAILKGAFMFLADLIRHVNVPCHVEFVRLSSYGSSTTSSGTVRPVDLTLPNLANEDVLLIEDIVDTGLTLSFFMEYLESLHKTKSLRLAVLLDKPAARTQPVRVDFTGFTVGNEFVIGYGLDCAGLYRNLPYIGVVKDPPSA